MSDQPNNQAARGEFASFPDKCPITRRPFFMVLEHPELGLVPTYGGPYDSYTIPHMEGQPDQLFHERELACHRYDHDLGSWHADEEGIPLRIVNEDVLNELQDLHEKASEQPPAGDRTGNAVAPRWLTELEGVCKGLEAEQDGGWSPDARSHVRRLRVFVNMMQQESTVQPAKHHPIDPGVAAELERSDWTPEAALRFYAAGKHYDTVPNGDGTRNARILDNGAIASNALKALSRAYAVHKGDVALEETGLTAQQPLSLEQINDICAGVIADPAASIWLKYTLQRALQRDPIDAAHDAQVLADILSKRADQVLASHGITNAPR